MFYRNDEDTSRRSVSASVELDPELAEAHSAWSSSTRLVRSRRRRAPTRRLLTLQKYLSINGNRDEAEAHYISVRHMLDPSICESSGVPQATRLNRMMLPSITI